MTASLYPLQAYSDYTLEVALIQWVNPTRSTYFDNCCDTLSVRPPNCIQDFDCETQFHICPQPFSFSSADSSCPYGQYSTKPDTSLADSDSITFTFGVFISGNIPNPMSFNVQGSISVSCFQHAKY